MKLSLLFCILFCCIATSQSGFLSVIIQIFRVLTRVVRGTIRRGRNLGSYQRFGNPGGSITTPLLTNQAAVARTAVSAGGRMGNVLKKIGRFVGKPSFAYGVVAADIAAEVIEAIVASAVAQRSLSNISDEEFEKSLRDWFPNQDELTELYTKEAEENPEVYSIDAGLMSFNREEITEDVIESLTEMMKNLNINDKAELIIADEYIIDQEPITAALIVADEEVIAETGEKPKIETNTGSSSCSACAGMIFLVALKLLVILLI